VTTRARALDETRASLQIAWMTDTGGRWHGRLAAALAVVALAGGALSFGAWAFDVPRLADWFNDGVSIQPNTAVLITLSGLGLVASRLGLPAVRRGLGAFIAAAGALTLSQYFFDVDLGFNHPLTFGRAWGGTSTVSPGRMGPPAATSFILIGTAIALLGAPAGTAKRRFVPLLGIAVAVIGAFSLTGRLFGAEPLYTVPWLTAIALQTALMLLAIAAVLILAVPDEQPMRMLRSDTGAGALARRIVPALVLLPPLLGWLRMRGEALGYYDTGTGRAMLVLGLAVLGVGLLWRALIVLARHEAASRDSAAALLREQENVADALREGDRRKNEFLAILAHELRGPLAPLRNSLELVKRSGGDGSVFSRAHVIMERQLGHLARLVDDLIDVSRITRDRLEIRREPTELAGLLRGCIEGCRSWAEQKALHLGLELPATPLLVDGDAVRLTQVFSNILHNAVKCTDDGGRIDCVVTIDRHDVVVRIRDTGIGIAKDQLGRVFEMFTQLDQGRDRTGGGLGIGLTLARRLVELHGGTVTADSAGPGRGSEFTVRLPALAGSAARGSVATTEQPGVARGCRFLVVDDNRDTAATLASLLELSGHETAVAHDGLEAVEAAERFRPHAILLDIGLPRLNGYEACRHLRERDWCRQVAIVALTGWGQEADRERSRGAGFDHHMVKPVDYPTLIALVGRTLAGRAPARAAALAPAVPKGQHAGSDGRQ
jgi:signal transduction histidine kinase/ActR/RegA family two-component response regulator